MHLEKHDTVYVLTLDDTDNRFTASWVAKISALIAQVAADPNDRALVTAGVGKFWSNGLDLDWMRANPSEVSALVIAVHELYAVLLEADFPTVAAVQGHCYAAGAMLALAHDARIFRADRGFICLPEVDIKIAFTPGMSALVTARLGAQTAHQAMVFGRRYGGDDALSAGIVDEILPEGKILDRAIAYAAELAGKDRKTLRAIKQGLYAPAIAALRNIEANAELRGFAQA